jgi:predicted NodU family carbamoyl transferase
VGASLALNYLQSPDPSAIQSKCFDHVYLGPEYPESYIQRMLAAEGVKYCRHSDIEDEIARLIAD